MAYDPLSTRRLDSAILQTKGDLIIGTGATPTYSKLPVGSTGQILVSDPTQTLGVKWGTSAVGATIARTAIAVVGFTTDVDFKVSDYASADLAVQAAVNSLVTTGGTVILREGVFNFNNQVTVGKSISIVGSSLSDNFTNGATPSYNTLGKGTIIRWADSRGTAIVNKALLSFLGWNQFSNFSIDGNTTHNSFNGSGIAVVGNRVWGHDVYIASCGQNGLDEGAIAPDITISNNFDTIMIRNCFGYGYVGHGNANSDTQLININIGLCGRVGVPSMFLGGGPKHLTNCHIWGGADAGIDMNPNGGFHIFENCDIETNVKEGLLVKAPGVTLIGTRIWKNGYNPSTLLPASAVPGVRVTDTTKFKAIGCTILDNNGAGFTFDGNSTDWMVDTCDFYDEYPGVVAYSGQSAKTQTYAITTAGTAGGGIIGVGVRARASDHLTGDYNFAGSGSTTVFAESKLTPISKSANYTAAPNDLVIANISGGSFTITLPTTPADRTRIGIQTVASSTGNFLTINTGGSDVFNKAGGGTSLKIISPSQRITVQYSAAVALWYTTGPDSNSDSSIFNSIPVDGVTDASATLTTLDGIPNDVSTLAIRNGESLYINSDLTLNNIELNVKNGGLIKVAPGHTLKASITNPGLRTILDTTIQNIVITATGGAFTLHGGSSATSSGTSATVNVSGLTVTILQTAIRNITGFNGSPAASVASLGGGVYQVTFGSNLLTNLTVIPDATALTTGNVTIQRGVFCPINQPVWDVQWWGQVNTFDDSATHQNCSAAAAASCYVDQLGSITSGRRIRLPYGKNQFFGVTYAGCHLEADIAQSVFFPPNWNPASGTMLTIGDFCTLTGGTWRTAASGQAVTLILESGYRAAVEDIYLAHQAYGSIGVSAGVLGMSGSSSPTVRRIRGGGNSTQRLLTISGGASGTFKFRGGPLGTTPVASADITLPATFSTLTTGLQSIPGYSAKTVTGTGPFTVNITGLGFLDIDTSGVTSGTLTLESFGTGIQVNSPDFKGEDIVLGSFKYGIQSTNGAGRLHKFHPFSCDYGLAGTLSFWTVLEPYWDTNNIWGMDGTNANGLNVMSIQSETNGYALGGGCMRIQRIGAVACSDVVIKGGVLDDDYNTMILIDGCDGADIDITMRSQNKRSHGTTPNTNVGINITSASTRTTVKARASRDAFITAAIIDNSVDCKVELGSFHQMLATDVPLALSSITYQTIISPGPTILTGEIWDVSLKVFTDAVTATPDIKNRINPGAAGATGPLMQVNGAAPSNTSSTFGSTQPSNAVQMTNGNAGIVSGLGSLRTSSNDGVLTSGSPNISSGGGAAFTWTAADVGSIITSNLAGIPTDTTIITFTDATHVVMSANATASQSTAIFTQQHAGQLTGLLFEGTIDNTLGGNTTIAWQAAQNTADSHQVTIRKGSVFEGIRRA